MSRVWFLIAMMVTALVAACSSSAITRAPLQVGVAAYSWNWDGPDLFASMRDEGMTGVRLALYRDRAAFDLQTLQDEIPVAQANGIEVVVNLNQEAADPTEGFASWAASMTVALPSVHRFVIGNEVNAALFWAHSVQDYVDMLAATRTAIHAVRPDAVVSGFALTLDPAYDPVGFLIDARVAAAPYGGLASIMDTLSLHVGTGFNTQVHKIEDVWKGYINLDEAGFTVGAGYTEATQATAEKSLLNFAYHDPKIGNVFFYRYRDSLVDPNEPLTANVRADGTKRPGWDAVHTWILQND